MSNSTSEPKQATKAPGPHDGWLTRAQVAAELGRRSIFPIRKMEGTKLHPVREARGWVFDPAEVCELKLTRTAPRAEAPAMSEGRVAARVFYLFDHGRELREIVEELEVPPGTVRELWHEWMTDLQEGELERRKTTQEERRRRREREEMRELERRSEQDEKNFSTMMADHRGDGGERQGLDRPLISERARRTSRRR
jgi:hypothetical protein